MLKIQQRTLASVLILFGLYNFSNCDEQEVRLLTYLMSTYDSSVRPASHFSLPLNITFSLSLHHIIDVDEKNQILTTNCWMTQVWTDHHLIWNSSEFGGIKVIRIPYSRIWRPDIILYNNADSQYSSSVINTNIIVTFEGEVTWLSHGIYKSSCDIDVEYFPFDIQNCTLKWASWTYDGYQLDLQIEADEGDLSNYHANGEFDLISFKAVRNNVFYSCCPEPYPDITFVITMKRRHFFYVFNLIIPCCLINGIALLVFFVPSDSGEKVTLGISALLSMTVFLMTIRESLPPTEKTPLIGFYYGVSICIVTSASAMAVVTLNIHHRGVRGIPVPKFIDFIILRVLAKILLFQKEPPIKDKSNQAQFHPQQRSSLRELRSIRTQLNILRPAFGCELDEKSTSRKSDYLDCVRMSPPMRSDSNPTPTSRRSLRRTFENIETSSISYEMSLNRVVEKINKSLDRFEERREIEGAQSDIVSQWKKVAYTIDRVLFYLFTISTLISTALILTSSPYGPWTRT